jgi:tricarballylate dehydrogenase
MDEAVDVVIVGGGNAGLSAAHAAAARGRRTVVLEKASRAEAGGNSYYTAGAFRVVHHGLEDLGPVLDHDDRLPNTVVPAYTAQDFGTDMARLTNGRNDPVLTRALVDDSHELLGWLHGLGLRFRLMYERQAYRTADGTYRFWGGVAVGSTGGGQGLIEQHTAAAQAAGVDIRYGWAATELLRAGDRVAGVRWSESNGREGVLRAESVILAAGGFEANADLRARYLGPEWKNAKVRGTPNNTGEMLVAAMAIGAAPNGDWTTCHSVAWDAGHPRNESNRQLTNRLTRGGYPLGIIVNAEGRRFVDEGADFRNFTYARYGADVLRQPGGVAYQVFDAQTRPLLRVEEYDMPGVSGFSANSIEALAGLVGIDPVGLRVTVDDFNASIDRERPFDPTILDHRAARTTPPKSNWAVPLDKPPYYAFPVTCGITFTFGGLRADDHGRVLAAAGSVIDGLYVCGEMLGGLFSGNYPGGTGLTSGAVFGRRCGALA